MTFSVPTGPFEVAGAVVGLLLVLRINAGYDRWWEARKLWGGIVNQSRNLAVSGLAYGPTDETWRLQFIQWIAVFAHATRRSLRGEDKLPELTTLITDDQVHWLRGQRHMPNAVSREIASLLAAARSQGMDGFAFLAAEKQRAMLIDHIGGCERILKTPLARSSAIQVRQFIFIFLVTLPVAMSTNLESTIFNAVLEVNESHRKWLIPLFVMLLGYMLLALDRIGMELQNPFDPSRIDFLPLDEICMTIEQNLLELLHEDGLYKYAARAVSDVQLPPDATSGAADNDLIADIS